MPVKDGDKIKVEYEGSFDDGEIFDSTKMHGGDPLEFQVGQHQVVPGFENAMLGKEINEEFQIHLEPKDAYGEYHDEGVQAIPRTQFPPEMDPQIGMIVELQQQHGDHTHPIPAKIIEVNETDVKLDLNHPLAGKPLNFKIKIVELN